MYTRVRAAVKNFMAIAAGRRKQPSVESRDMLGPVWWFQSNMWVT